MSNNNPLDASNSSTLLPEQFAPSDLDVICGWARQNHHHVGNKLFREHIDKNAPHYVTATTKLEKTQVIAAVIDKVRSDSPGGGFVKKDFHTGRWCEIGNEKARDKVGHAIRKAAEEIQKEKGIQKAPSKKSQKALPARASQVQKEKKAAALSSFHSPVKLNASTAGSLPSLANPISNLSSSMYGGDHLLLPPSFASRSFLSRQHLMADGHLMPGLDRIAGLYEQTPQAYMNSFRALSSIASSSSNILHPLRGTTHGSLLLAGLSSGNSALPTPASAPSNAALADRLAALSELEMQQSIMSAYNKNPGVNHQGGRVTQLEHALLAQRSQQTMGTQYYDHLLGGNSPLAEAKKKD